MAGSANGADKAPFPPVPGRFCTDTPAGGEEAALAFDDSRNDPGDGGHAGRLDARSRELPGSGCAAPGTGSDRFVG